MDRLHTLAEAARFDICSGCGGNNNSYVPASPLGIVYNAALPNGRTAPLLKVLLTNCCVNDCGYCVNQVGRDIPRCTFQPEELAKTFAEMHGKKLVQGLFLSSGIGADASRTMEKMIEVVEILRFRHAYRGYIHLKILPGARYDCVEAACRLASRVSVNIEAPTAQHLARLSRKKDLHDGILERMKWVKQLTARDEKLAPSGQTTQFVVGAAGETDGDIIQASDALYKDMGLRRVYFSAFRPVSGSSLEGVDAAPPMREHRLYQADWLLRVYRFSYSDLELALGKDGSLSLGNDPKLTIASRQPWLFPIDLNKASYDDLIRVPGIGPAGAKRILAVRQERNISSVQQLKKLKVVTGRALPFIRFNGMLAVEKQASFLPLLDDAADWALPAASEPLLVH